MMLMPEPVAPRWHFLPPEPSDDGIDSAFEMLLSGYPAGAIGNVAAARHTWDELTKKDRRAAVRFIGHALRAWRNQGKRPPTLANYLRNADWHRVSGQTNSPESDALTLRAFVRPTWCLLWRAVAAGKRVEPILRWLSLGVTIPASAAPSQVEESALLPVKVGSTECGAWVTHCAKLGFRLPLPDQSPVIFVPSSDPPALPKSWKGYALIEPCRVAYLSQGWWWRVYQPGAPVADLLEQARRNNGTVIVEMGPVASPAESASMVEIKQLSDEFAAWSKWFWSFKASIEMWPAHAGPVFVPTRWPMDWLATKEKEGAAA